MGVLNNYKLFVSFSIIVIISSNIAFVQSAVVSKQDSFSTSVSNVIAEKTNFDGFLLTNNHDNIHSTINTTHAYFKYYGDDPSEPIWERYSFFLPENCSDFLITVSLDYFTNETSGIFINYLKLFGEEHSIAETGVQDGGIASQARFYVKAWPDGEGLTEYSADDIGGTSGSVEMKISRENNVVSALITDKSSQQILYSQEWVSGLSTLCNGFAITFRSGLLGAYTEALFYDFYAICYRVPLVSLEFDLPVGFISSLIACSLVVLIIFRKRKG